MLREEFPTTYRGEPLKPHVSCVHLLPQTEGGIRRYGRCALGTAEDRAVWVQQQRSAQLEAIRTLRQELYQELERVLAAVADAKHRQLAAHWLDRAAPKAELEQLRQEATGQFSKALDTRPELLEAAELEPGELVDCFSAGIAEYIQRRDALWRMSESVLVGRRWQTKLYFRPDLVGRRAGLTQAT